MKRTVKTTILAVAMSALLCCSTVPAFAASTNYIPKNITSTYDPNKDDAEQGIFDTNAAWKEYSGGGEIRLMDGQSYDFYVSGPSMTESDAQKMVYFSEDSNVATIQYVGFDPIKGFQFRVTANLKGTPKKTDWESENRGEVTTDVRVAYTCGTGGDANIIVTKKGKLGLSTTDVKMMGKTGGSTYDFYVLGVNDPSKLKVTSNNTSVATVQLVDANDPRGAKYRITALPNNSGASKAQMGTKFAYIDVEYNGQKRDIRVQNYSVAGSIMVDTVNYTMPVNGTYQVGLTIKDGDGNKLTAEEVKWLLDANVLRVSDSRTGSIVNLQQLSNGNFRVTAKKAGTTYILFEINDVHTSLRVDVKDGAKAQGAATRDTIYWSFASDSLVPVRFTTQSQYYYDANGKFDEQAIINDVVALGKQMRMTYTPDLIPMTPQNRSNSNLNTGGWNPPEDMYIEPQFRTESYQNALSEYASRSFSKSPTHPVAKNKDVSAWYTQCSIFQLLLGTSDRSNSKGSEQNQRFNVCFLDISKDVPNAGKYSLFIPYG